MQAELMGRNPKQFNSLVIVLTEEIPQGRRQRWYIDARTFVLSTKIHFAVFKAGRTEVSLLQQALLKKSAGGDVGASDHPTQV
jgi:hypothetical protein